jgi:hypothetical protein
MAIKEFAHLIKPLPIKEPPQGLYAEPRIWMESKDMEGFNALFSYGFVKKPSTFHPLKGMLIHPYDEILVFEGTKNTDIFYLGAEVSVRLGEEQEEHTFTEPSCVLIPKGLPHGPATVKSLERPIVHYTIGLDAAYKAESVSPKSTPATKGDKYRKYIKKMTTNFKSMGAQGSGWTGEQQYGSIKAADMGVGPGNGDEVVWLYGEDLEGFNVNFTWGFYSRCGKWHRGGEAHYHPEAEILVFVGLDPDKLDFLGAELELGMGKDYERHIFNTPTVAICPAAFPHLPLITRWVDKPYGFIVVCLSGEHASPWVEA